MNRDMDTYRNMDMDNYIDRDKDRDRYTDRDREIDRDTNYYDLDDIVIYRQSNVEISFKSQFRHCVLILYNCPMALSRLPDTDAVLTDIQQENGMEFMTKRDRDDYIVDYYRQVYDNNDVADRAHTTIDNFLGNVSTHPDVINSKLNDDEREDLDRPSVLKSWTYQLKKRNQTAPLVLTA
jgi:hypothetical protein